MSETKDENIKLVEADPAENKDDEKKAVTGYYLFQFDSNHQRCPKSVLSIGFVLSFLHTNIYEKLNTNPILNTD